MNLRVSFKIKIKKLEVDQSINYYGTMYKR